MDKQDSENVKKPANPVSNLSLPPTYSELLKSSAIHGALMGNLTGIREGSVLYRANDGSVVCMMTQLVTYARDVIRIYNVEMQVEPHKASSKGLSEFRLSLTHEVPLFGNIKKVNMIHNKEEGDRGYLVVLYEDHKVSTLALDALTNTLSVVDLHNFETPATDASTEYVLEKYKKGQQTFHEDPVVRVDKFNRCVATLMYRTVLTLMLTNSFYQSLEVNLADENTVLPNFASLNLDPNAGKPFYGMTYYLNFAEYNLNNPIDFAIVEHSKDLRIYVLNRLSPIHRGANGARQNAGEVMGLILNKKFFTSPLYEKNKIKATPKENLESYECGIKFKFLPSDSFRILCLPKNVFLVISPYMILYFDTANRGGECIGFLVNQQYGNTEDYAKQYYKCNIVNTKTDCQLDLRNFKFEILDSRYILLAGIGVYLLRIDVREGIENMELIKIPELIDNRSSFMTVNSKTQKDNQHLLFLGSYMSHAQLVDLKVYTDPRQDQQTMKKMRFGEDRAEAYPMQMEDIYYNLEMRDTVKTTSPISDLIAPKASSSNPFHLVASCSYGKDSSLLFMQIRVELKPTTDMHDVDRDIKDIISVKDPDDSSNFTKYLLLSKEEQTQVLIYDNGQLIEPHPDNIQFLLTEPTLQCKRLKLYNNPIIIQLTSHHIRFINPQTRDIHEVPVTHAIECRLKGQTIVVLTAQRTLEVYTFEIPQDGVVGNIVFRQREFQETNVTCFALFKRRKAFPEGWNKDDIVLAATLDNHTIKLFLMPEDITKPIQSFFYCPHLNEGASNLFNVIDEGDKVAATLLTRIITDSSIANPRGVTMKASCPYQIEEIYLRELHQNILLIVRISNGEYFFYKSYSNDFHSRYALGYSIGFQRIIAPIFKFSGDNKIHKSASLSENQMAEETSGTKMRIRTVFKHKYQRQKSCICICSDDVYIWLFFNKDEIFFHSTRRDQVNNFQSLCDFNIPDCESFFTGIVNGKLNAYSLNNLSLDYENALPLKKANVGRTVRNLLSYPQAEPRYVVFTSSQRSPYEETFQINLMDIKSQTVINSITADKNMKIIKMKTIDLIINGAKISLIAVIFFTSSVPESYAHSGKVALYNVDKGTELNLLHEITFGTDPVTDVFAINGFLFVCLGHKIEWHRVSMDEERKFSNQIISYLFTEKSFIAETLVLPNFLICSDIRRSLSVLYWQVENPIKIAPKGDSFRTHTLYAIEFFDSLSDNLRVLTADGEKNVSLLSFSVTTQKMEKVADFHVGSLVTKFRRHRSQHKSHDTLLLSTNEGGLAFIGTYDAGSYHSLTKLQNLLAIEFPFIAGLHPKGYRLYNSNDHNERVKPKKGFLDGNLINFYCHLSYSMQTKIAKGLRESRENLLNLIYSLFSINSVF